MRSKIKKILAIIMCVSCVLCLCSCQAEPTQKSGKIKVVTTIFPLYDFVRAVGGDRVDITLLIAPGTEVHSYDPKPSDIRAIYEADLFTFIGGESDSWVNTLLEEKEINTLKMYDSVNLIEEHDHHHHEYDEHIWTSPENAVLMVESIFKALSHIDKEKKAVYRENADKYIAQIKAVDSELERLVDTAQNPFILVADRFPFLYLAERYGIEYEAAFGGCAVSTDISIKTMSSLVKVCEERKLKYAYFTEMSNKNIAKALSEQTGVKLLELHSAHNVTKDDFRNGVTYADIMRRNLNALKEGLE